MKSRLFPWQLFVVSLAGWVNREQQRVIEYLKEENRVLLEMHGKRRLWFSDTQRRRLAVIGKKIGRRLLKEWATIVNPDTILRWHRDLVAAARTYPQKSDRVRGRPRTKAEIAKLVCELARDNPSWGYTRILGALKNLRLKVSRTTIANILAAYGIDPSPTRGKETSWNRFLRSHWNTFSAMDFFEQPVWTSRGLVSYYILLVIELRTRRIHIAGVTPNPNRSWMEQVARNLTDREDGFLKACTHLILDRDGKFTSEFQSLMEGEGIELVKLPPRSPNLNAFAERVIRSIKTECLGRMIFFHEKMVRRALREFVSHYHAERNHQGIGNELIESGDLPRDGPIQCRERLGGLLRYYYREAA